MTKKQLEKFIRIRNNSQFSSNLQFQIDCNTAGFNVSDLGTATPVVNGYEWITPFGKLIEDARGKLHLRS